MPYRINPFSGELDLVLGPGEGTGATDFATDSGSASPTGSGVITLSGGTGINTSGASSTVTINLDDPVVVDNGGTGQTSLTDGAILIGDGSNPVELIGPLTDGQLLIGDTAGVSPVAANLTAGTGITITNGAGSIQIEASSSMAINFDTDSGTATPAANTLNIVGSGLVDTAGASDTVTINVDSPVVVANGGTGATTLTDGGILLGSGSSPITATSQPTNGQLLIGSTGVDPVLGSLTSTGSTITITAGAGTINLETDASVPTQFDSDSGSAVPALGVLDILGGTLLSTSGATNTITVNADDNVVGSVSTDGSAATPASNAFTIAGGTGCATSGSGSTVTIDLDASVPTSFPTDSGTATPSGNSLTVAGGTLLNTSGSGSTVTVNADDSVVGTVGSDSGTATPSSNNFDIVGTGGITTSGATDTITIDGSAISDFDWNVETGTSATMAVNNGYIANNASTVTFTLPDTAAVGDEVRVTSIQAAWSIAQNAGETIYFGDQSTTTGAGGSMTSTDTRDAVHLVCVVANTDWQVLSSIGNLTIV
jgi:hypothetical protein